jgi:hypothetical protein
LDFIGNNLQASSRRFISSNPDIWRQPSERFPQLPVKSIECF